ncbi:pre-rRNA-processing protein esf1 [Coemansia erecta]|uniref:Pre-rRNA-processing protein esf1 n=1 Tax=Coemansia erecta TaxID=147472 RepID=A0A9W8CW02_9FUNG|nr:pre-rRNA-processing protein esf1 [Coemansia erecta]
MAPKKDSAAREPARKVTQDARFSHVQQDPRFIRPKKSQSKVKVDKRFAHMIKDKDFIETTKVDRYGRLQEDNRAENYLRNTYDFSGSESGSESDSESGSGDEDEEEDSDSQPEEDSESEGEDDIAAAVDRARGQGVNSDESSDSDDDSDISDVDWGKVNGEEDGGFSDVIEDPDDIPRGEETRRFACVNLDWDHVRAIDLLAVFNGFKPDGGAVLSVKIFPSDFGKERMSRESVEGPPTAIFAQPKKKGRGSSSGGSKEEGNSVDSGSDSDSESDVDLIKEQVADNEEFNQIALRKYELERLRYYYAIVECDSVETAFAIYKQCDGTEYEASANCFDLRFVPDDLVFEDKPKEEATHIPEKYEPVEFATQAMQHSNVKLTWDADEPSRTRVTRKAFTQDEIDNMDFSNLLASSSDDSSDDEAELARKRALLLSGGDKDSDDEDDSDSDNDNMMGDMEITFTPGLSEAAASRMSEKKKAEEEADRRANETTIERFRRVKQERKEKRKESKKGRAQADDSDNLISDNELDANTANDPFFTYSDEDGNVVTPKSAKDAKNGKGKGKKKETKSERKQRHAQEDKQRAELELLLDGADGDRKHFDMDEIIKAEKRKGKKKSKKHGKDVDAADADDFSLDTKDPRFGALFESHNFAIDPNNPNFKKTKAMTDLLNESRKRRKTNVN